MTSPRPVRKNTRERALEACRNAMALFSEVTHAIATAELLQTPEIPDDPEIEAHLESARTAVTTDFTRSIAIAGGQPAGTGKDLQFWKVVCTGLQVAKDRVAAAENLINSKRNSNS